MFFHFFLLKNLAASSTLTGCCQFVRVGTLSRNINFKSYTGVRISYQQEVARVTNQFEQLA